MQVRYDPSCKFFNHSSRRIRFCFHQVGLHRLRLLVEQTAYRWNTLQLQFNHTTLHSWTHTLEAHVSLTEVLLGMHNKLETWDPSHLCRVCEEILKIIIKPKPNIDFNQLLVHKHSHCINIHHCAQPWPHLHQFIYSSLINSSTQNCKFRNICHDLLLTFPTQSMFIHITPEHILFKLSHTYFGTDNSIRSRCLVNRSITAYRNRD